MKTETAVGREAYARFLRDVALVPFTPDELLAMGRQEWERAVAFEALEQGRNRALPQMPVFPTARAQVEASATHEQGIRDFLASEGLLTVPAWTQHYLNLPLPPYLAPLAFLGVTDDLTGPTRLAENGYSYIRQPSMTLPYFYLSTARDPRPIIVHEGVPGHYLQLALAWAHENPIRRQYYDSGANEGIGFYAEEMMLQAGLWRDSPRSREIIYNFMRLRALRVEVDVRLATGTFTIAQAADYLEKTVPMDHETALEEAASFAAGPGQGITYQIGKLQIVRMLADAKRAQGPAFSLRAFHDFVWKNGNLPLALVRWEMLGDKGDVESPGRDTLTPVWRLPRARPQPTAVDPAFPRTRTRTHRVVRQSGDWHVDDGRPPRRQGRAEPRASRAEPRERRRPAAALGHRADPGLHQVERLRQLAVAVPREDHDRRAPYGRRWLHPRAPGEGQARR